MKIHRVLIVTAFSVPAANGASAFVSKQTSSGETEWREQRVGVILRTAAPQSLVVLEDY